MIPTSADYTTAKFGGTLTRIITTYHHRNLTGHLSMAIGMSKAFRDIGLAMEMVVETDGLSGGVGGAQQ